MNLGRCSSAVLIGGKERVMREEEEEKEEEEEGYFCRREFLTKYKAPVASNHPKIVYLGAHFAGRAI